MTRERFKEHFTSDDGAFLVIRGKNAPYRADGQPLTQADRELIAGKDPLAAQLKEQEQADHTA